MHLKVVAQDISQLCTFITFFPLFGLILENGLKTENRIPPGRTELLVFAVLSYHRECYSPVFKL